MLTASDCLLKAENYGVAAKMAEGRKRRVMLAAAAYWRNRAFNLRMERFRRLRETSESVKAASDKQDMAD